jgi:hypothetical protein
VSWGADPRLLLQLVNARGGAVRSRSRRPSIEPQDALALSTPLGVRPMIAITPLARAAEVYARMDAERRSLRHSH